MPFTIGEDEESSRLALLTPSIDSNTFEEAMYSSTRVCAAHQAPSWEAQIVEQPTGL